MRKPQNPRRARGRNPGGRQQGNNRQRRPHQNSANRIYESQGPDGRVKGTPAQLHERYSNASRDVRGNDRILAESLLQYADHYYRLAAEFQDNQAENRTPPRQSSEEQPRTEDRSEDRTAGLDKSADKSADKSEDKFSGNSADKILGPDQQKADNSGQTGADSKHAKDSGHTDTRSQKDNRVTEDDIPMLRRRGRPRRKPVDAEGTEQPSLINLEDSASDTPSKAPGASEAEGEEKPAPRRRGRPRKSEAAAPADSAADSGDGEASPAPRRRGRPRKVDTAATEAASGANTADGEEKPAPRRRGRPRKSETAASAEPETAS